MLVDQGIVLSTRSFGLLGRVGGKRARANVVLLADAVAREVQLAVQGS